MPHRKHRWLEPTYWVALTALNGGMAGFSAADGDVKWAWFSGILGTICAIYATFAIYDWYIEWQDERYERKYLASLPDVELLGDMVDEEVDVDARTIDVFTKE